MSYFAQLNASGAVVRVVVCDSAQWLTDRLGGTWVETQISSPDEQYAGIGMGCEEDHPRRFAPQWSQPAGPAAAFSVGAYVWHGDRIWQSTTPSNVWTPGVFGWRDKTDLIPPWRQPAGAGDEWKLGDEVLHKGKHWRSNHAANVWEPGAAGIGSNIWEDITVLQPPSAPAAWVQPTGAHDAYQIGARVTHGGFVWVSTAANNVWTPGQFGWVQE